MRWDGQKLSSDDAGALPGMTALQGFVRSVQTPEFAGVTFHEVHAKSALNKVTGESDMPFGWTINPYRGCLHQCVYCFARNTHTYLDFDAGSGFDTQIVVKTNIGEVLRRELAKPSWRNQHVALGTNTDPYQRAEGRYRLMPGIIEALAGAGTPFSILTKGTLIRRDLKILVQAAERVPVGIGISLALLAPELQDRLEPGTPSPRARLELIKAITDAGLPCGVFIAPVLPWLNDNTEQLDQLLAGLAGAGATGVTVSALHLRPGTKDWFMQWLGREHPELVERYESLYAAGAYAPRTYRDRLRDTVRPLLTKHGFNRDANIEPRRLSRRTGFPAGLHPQNKDAPRETANPALF
ncbi:Rv2578c family radical SAM protein [Saxibacter everestensis]|uniref:Rv2578c family radical SAM protein n=1 Tax=Saxibacter everestensis TaxID=2909229 RepID=A0ABY8QZL3_9MICO|nr:Rv2578c family radical SAM protein [Brevibacteriaceae bacterium ZFBP1038]